MVKDLKKMEKAYIKHVAYYLPERIVTNEDIVKNFSEKAVEKISDNVGIQQRHRTAPGETASDMALKAANALFDESGIERESIDFVVLCTQCADYFMPSTACVLQNRLGLRKDIGAFDIDLGCSGYVYGLAIAKSLILGGLASNVLLLTADNVTRYLHPQDKGNQTLFGDAATATVVSTEGRAEIMDFVLGTDGAGANNLIVKSGASRMPERQNDLTFDKNGSPVSSDHMYMNGAQIFVFTQRIVPKLVKDVLAKNNLNQEDIDLFVFHQANRFMLDFLRKKLGVAEDRFCIYLENFGNTASNTIPISLVEARKENRVKGKVMLCGFGVGYSWAGVVLNVNQ